ncbi:MAG TPA: prepilin-type N-terminal cleavage/methylation domain-containing protein [Candidatus Babeliales bacterium]|jgi:prepilin-type N-terminal cleavage/methylation domain-containing protein|nr:prepilin-type N-terminal cleavage/methylation domain-containing protein [Candidatus Babeliales bacterium]
MKSGFTLIELMVVVAIVVFLTMLAIPNFTRFLAKAKRTEAYANLHALYMAQKAYWAEHGTYAPALAGPQGAGWQPEGYKGGGLQENFYYTYGLPGTEGTHYFTGKLNTPASLLSGGYANKDSFVIMAAGYINGEKKPDILSINQDNKITIVQDALL